MDSDSDDELDELPLMVRSRLERLDDPDPLQFARKAIPALGNRTISQVLIEDEDGLVRVMTYITRLEELVGIRGDY